MRLGFIFTDDWELFGNGSGDIQKRQIEPAYRFMEISEQYGAKYTFMAEVSQYWSFKAMAGRFPELAKGVEQWEKTLKDAIRRGHDVQLHIHPQWYGAAYENGSWKLNMKYWSLPSLSPENIRLLIRRGKQTLEELLKPVNPDYTCSGFRSGAWLTQPSSTIIKILSEEGILCDTSVLPGGRCSDMLGDYNYIAAYSNLFPWWVKQDDINRQESDIAKRTVIELPIYTEIKRLPTLYPYLIKKFRDRKCWLKKVYPPSERPTLQLNHSNVCSQWLSKFWQVTLGRRVILFDHGQLSANHMLAMVKRIRKRTLQKESEAIVPVMSITHSKISYFYDEYEEFLKKLRALYGDDIVFLTFSEAGSYLRKLPELPSEDSK